jgi:hypothetical protein
VRGRNLIAGIVLLLAPAATASTWSVQRDGTGDFTTIQPALDVAADGDTILIGPGEYTEAATVRLPGWAYDIQSYANLRCDNLTIIGAGADATVIGPSTYQGNAATGNPAGLSYSVGGGTLNIRDAQIRLQQGALSRAKNNTGVVPLLALVGEWRFAPGWFSRTTPLRPPRPACGTNRVQSTLRSPACGTKTGPSNTRAPKCPQSFATAFGGNVCAADTFSTCG